MLAVRTDLTLSFQKTWKATLPLLQQQLSPCGLMSVIPMIISSTLWIASVFNLDSVDAVLNDNAVVVIKLSK